MKFKVQTSLATPLSTHEDGIYYVKDSGTEFDTYIVIDGIVKKQKTKAPTNHVGVSNTTETISITSSEVAITGLSITVPKTGKYNVSLSTNFLCDAFSQAIVVGELVVAANSVCGTTVRIKKNGTNILEFTQDIVRSGRKNYRLIKDILDLNSGDVLTVHVSGVIPSGASLSIVNSALSNTNFSIDEL